MNLPPWLVLALLVTLTLALVYQLASRHFGWRVLFYWALVFLAFVGAEALAESLGWNITRLGDLRFGPDLGAALAMTGALWRLHI